MKMLELFKLQACVAFGQPGHASGEEAGTGVLGT
jgi:hypothetical protein